MRYALLISAVALLAGCGGGAPPPAADWIVGTWQMYACENYATGEIVPVDELGVSGEACFEPAHRWQAWREGWPGGRVEASGKWELIRPNVYEVTTAGPFNELYRRGAEFYSVGGFGPELYRFWYRRA